MVQRLLRYKVNAAGLLLALLLLTNPLTRPASAFVVNDDLLKIQAALYPKIILMDCNYKEKLVNETMTIVIVYPEQSVFYATKFMEYMKAKYRQGLKGYPVNIKMKSLVGIIAEPENATAFYLLPADAASMRKVVKRLAPHRLIFVYDDEDLRYGGHIGVEVGLRTKPVINFEAIKEGGITLRPILVKISKCY